MSGDLSSQPPSDTRDDIHVIDNNLPVQQSLPSHPSSLQLHSPPESQLYQDASSQSRTDPV